MLVQRWQDCAFLHWRYPPHIVRPHVPSSLDLDLLEGKAWVSSTTFAVPHMRLGPLPPVPGVRSGAESNLRTYVVDRAGRRGLWMLAMDFTPLPAVVAGRFPFLLPYWWAAIDVDRTSDIVRYSVERRPPGRSEMRLHVSIGDARRPEDLTARDRFLTSRWLLFEGVDPVLLSVVTNHEPWALHDATVVGLQQTVLSNAGLPKPDSPPIVHFSDGVLARIGPPTPVPGGGG